MAKKGGEKILFSSAKPYVTTSVIESTHVRIDQLLNDQTLVTFCNHVFLFFSQEPVLSSGGSAPVREQEASPICSPPFEGLARMSSPLPPAPSPPQIRDTSAPATSRIREIPRLLAPPGHSRTETAMKSRLPPCRMLCLLLRTLLVLLVSS